MGLATTAKIVAKLVVLLMCSVECKMYNVGKNLLFFYKNCRIPKH